MRVAQRVRGEIARQVGEAPVTISAGVATMPDNASDAERLMAAADGALYDAKRTGRDRVAGSGRGLELAARRRAQLVGAARTRRLSFSGGGSSPSSSIARARSSWWCTLPAAERRNESTSRKRRGVL